MYYRKLKADIRIWHKALWLWTDIRNERAWLGKQRKNWINEKKPASKNVGFFFFTDETKVMSEYIAGMN